MDWALAALIGVGVGGFIGLAGRAIATWERIARIRIEEESETARMKSAWWQQMQQRQKNQKKGTKKGEEADDDDLIKALGHPLVRGFAEGAGIDVDALADGKPAEWKKLKQIGENLQRNGGLQMGSGDVVRG